MKIFIIFAALLGYSYSQTETTATTEPPPSIDCVAEGFVANPKDNCSNHYYICDSELVGERKFCDNPTLVFDQVSKTCVDADDLDECGPPFEKMGPLVDCKVLGPGNFANPKYPCSSFFFSCHPDNMTLLNRSCAAVPNTKYDAVSDACLFPAYVEACGGNATTTTQQPTEPTPVNATSAPLPDIDCSGGAGNRPHPDIPCSSDFFACLSDNVTLVRFTCGGAPFTKYDNISNSCLFPEYVEACGGTATTPSPPEGGEKPEDMSMREVRRKRAKVDQFNGKFDRADNSTNSTIQDRAGSIIDLGVGNDGMRGTRDTNDTIDDRAVNGNGVIRDTRDANDTIDRMERQSNETDGSLIGAIMRETRHANDTIERMERQSNETDGSLIGDIMRGTRDANDTIERMERQSNETDGSLIGDIMRGTRDANDTIERMERQSNETDGSGDLRAGLYGIGETQQ